MIKEVHVELFRFDSKLDYLPYYKKYTIEYYEKETILNLLNKINSIDKFTYEATADFNLKINDLYLSSSESIQSVVDRTSSDFKIEPISIFRAINDLVIDKKDFLEKIDSFKSYITSTDIQKYAKNYELDYYASNTYNINRDYIGDHLLLIASDIIEQNPNLTEEILAKISKPEDGIFYHTSLENRIFNYDINREKIIKSLLNMLPKVALSTICTESVSKDYNTTVTQYFDGFNIASFEGINRDSSASIINDSKANYIEISLKNEDLAPYSALVSKDFSLKIAGEILLQAKDENADFIVVRGNRDIAIFDGEQKRIEKVVGREIKLPVISKEQFSKLVQGERNKSVLGLDTHKVNVSFL